VQISLVAAVATGYLNLLADEELLAITRQTLATREESLRLSKLRFDSGATSELDYRQAQSLTEAARVALAQQQRQRALDENALVCCWGNRCRQALPLTGTTAAVTLPELPAGLPSELLVRRPDIRQAEQQLVAANANIGAARAAFFPRIALTAGVGTASSHLSDLFSSGSWGWTLAPQALLPVFDAGRNQANLESVTAARELPWPSMKRPSRWRFARWPTPWPAVPRWASSCVPSRPRPTPKPRASTCLTCATATAWPATSICWTPSAPCSPRARPWCRRAWRSCRTRCAVQGVGRRLERPGAALMPQGCGFPRRPPL
jgi:hypothetical protein